MATKFGLKLWTIDEQGHMTPAAFPDQLVSGEDDQLQETAIQVFNSGTGSLAAGHTSWYPALKSVDPFGALMFAARQITRNCSKLGYPQSLRNIRVVRRYRQNGKLFGELELVFEDHYVRKLVLPLEDEE